MPRRSRVKKIAIKNDDDSDMLNKMFAQMTGDGDIDVDVVLPKLNQLVILMKKYSKIYRMILNFTELTEKFPENKESFDEIKVFVDQLDKICDIKKMPESLDEIGNLYKTLKQCSHVKLIIVSSGNLGRHKRWIGDRENLRDGFIKSEPGLTYAPLRFTKLDLKTMWMSEKMTKMAKKYFLTILCHTYTVGKDIHQIVTSPDIDITKYSKILIANIDRLKKQVPRCDKAFDMIAKSVTMLEDNFENYYKTSVEAENSSIIMESFIMDVSIKQKAGAVVTRQFKKIMMFMRRHAARSNDPRVAKMFKILNNQFSDESGDEI